MKTKEIIGILLGGFSLFPAQTTTAITKAFNDPAIGNVVNNYSVNGVVDHTAIGNNATFNNTNLTQGPLSITSYTAVTPTELITYPGSTIKMNSLGNTVFYKSTDSKLEITGIVTSQATLNFNSDNGTFITYPTAYGSTITDTAAGKFSSSLASGLFKGTITTSGDAYGTLMIGSQVYNNVLRVRSVQNLNLYSSFDTSYLVPLGVITNITYSYYDGSHKFPLLSSTSGVVNIPLFNISQSVDYTQVLGEVYLSTANFTLKEDFKIYPNPAHDVIHLAGKTRTQSSVNIYTAEGKLVKRFNNTPDKIDISALPRACYFIEVSNKDGKSEKLKLIKE
ncbi:T9SS type A sorting domain-containing protein [Chryseobacterium sp. ES2]|uniref:T9SS type A sorting domain-containing protein n=1 Tax=Chryseobacterium metallicongregator TaxID=3073042 RepID=A0ABU1DZU4_9FLAO|nr:T9SS type A sorting domain-containing protein [Chryseobacterium sp. ES2]MDR4951030.1 T9SS type A sorting domain-containing protein [Chryseobacterium sp. ES2]